MAISESLNTLVLVAVVALLLNVIKPAAGGFDFGAFSPLINITLGLAIVYALLQSIDGIIVTLKAWATSLKT